ncbi:MAG TPA: lipopolysaccharide biosynthesis protein [Thermogutta sp.]|mgnify:CR=1 FL=1|nr:lipopolysaccharide biosynthesis protein [Thermogutta sp.]HQF13639.1 lipopolysaccharide biosynthesis protein [Thermogutta sp.]
MAFEELPPLDAMAERLQRDVRRGSSAVFVAQVVSQLISLVVLAILLRTLGLEPYGLLGMVLPLLALVRIFIYSGLDVAAIQDPLLDRQRASALFWINQILGMLGTAIVAVSAPWISWFYGREELVPLTIALSGTMLVTTLGAQHQALLQRDLQLGRLSIIRVAAQVIGGVAALIAAWAGAGIWTLVVQQYAEPAALTVLSWVVTGWRPAFVLRGAGSRELLHFGGHYTMSAFLLYLMSHVDKIVVGRFLGSQALALYYQAFNLAQKPVGLVVSPLTGVMLPALARARSEASLYRQYATRFLRFLNWIMFPCGIGLALVADETMAVLGGPRWSGAGPILRIFALMIPFQALFNVTGTIYASLGRADRMARACIPVTAVMCVAFLVTVTVARTSPHAVHILAWVYFLTFAVSVLAYTGYAFWMSGLSLRSVLGTLHAIWLGLLLMIVAVWATRVGFTLLRFQSDYLLLFSEIVAGMIAYFIGTRRISLEYLIGSLKGFWPESQQGLPEREDRAESQEV